MRQLTIIFLIAWALVFATKAHASGVAVKPSKLEITSALGKSAEVSFLVINIDSAPAIYVIKPDSHGSLISFEPNSFQLEPGENRLVKVKAISVVPYFFDTNISIVSKALGADSLAASAGIKLPITVQVLPSLWQSIIIFLVATGLLVVYWRWIMSKKSADKSA